MGIVLAIANQKGGVGKTTTAINLSAALAESGQRVLAVDFDPQGNLTSGLGIEKNAVKNSVYEMLMGSSKPEETVEKTYSEKLDVLPANVNLSGAEIELLTVEERESVLKKCLELLRNQYDMIIIDCPPSLSLLTVNALTASDKVLIPIQCEYYALEGVTSLMNTVNRVKHSFNPGLDIEGVLLTMLDGRTNLGLQVVDQVKKHFRGKVYSTAIPRNVRLGEAPSHGVPIHQYDSRSLGAESYRQLAREFLERNQ